MPRLPVASTITYVRVLTCSALLGLFLGGSGCSLEEGDVGREQRAGGGCISGDDDGDLICNDTDNCPLVDNFDQLNSDADSFGDVCDNCVDADNEDQQNTDGDDFGDVCDNCVNDVNDGQTNDDGDSLGNACDNCDDTDNR